MRKEKLGDRITALHQLVSPFGKVKLLIYAIKKVQIKLDLAHKNGIICV